MLSVGGACIYICVYLFMMYMAGIASHACNRVWAELAEMH